MVKSAGQNELDHAVLNSFSWTQATAEAIGQQLAEVDFAPLFGLPVPDPRGRLRSQELRVVKKALFRQCLQLEPSVFFWRIFLALSGKRKKLLYRAFILNEALTAAQWAHLIGPQCFETWCASALLEQHENRFSWNARVVYTGHSALVLDDGSGGQQHVYCGRDSLVFLEFCLKCVEVLKRTRYLDVGVGVGPLLCGMAPHFRTAVGIDINPRAVQLARLNVEINKLNNVRTVEADVFELSESAERYDVVTWNVPYMFVPESSRRVCNDGGELGIGLAIKFMQRVPDLLNPEGVAFAMASSPILMSGHRPLHELLEGIAASKKLDIQIVGQWFSWAREHEDFLLANGVRAIEVVILVATKGNGIVEYVSGSLAARLGRLPQQVRRFLESHRLGISA